MDACRHELPHEYLTCVWRGAYNADMASERLSRRQRHNVSQLQKAVTGETLNPDARPLDADPVRNAQAILAGWAARRFTASREGTENASRTEHALGQSSQLKRG